VYRRPGEQYAQCNFVTKESFGGGSRMVWIGISLDVATEFVVLDRRNLNAHRYEHLGTCCCTICPICRARLNLYAG
jgi:hypothetical protein